MDHNPLMVSVWGKRKQEGGALSLLKLDLFLLLLLLLFF